MVHHPARERKKAEKRRALADDLVKQMTGRKFRIPHIAELTEAIFDQWAEEAKGGSPLKEFAKFLHKELTGPSTKAGSLQRAKLIQCQIDLLKLASQQQQAGTGDLSLLNDTDLLQAAGEVLERLMPREDDNDDEGDG